MKKRGPQLFIAASLLFLIVAGCGGQSPESQKSASIENQKSCEGFAANTLGQSLSWSAKFPIVLYPDANVPEQFIESIKNAAKTWNKAVGFSAFQIGDVSTQTNPPAQDGKNIIYWLNSWGDKSPDLQATTLLYWNDAGTDEADMLINAQNFKHSTNPNDDELDTESLVLHELGHILGLGHISLPSSVMAERLPFGTTRRSLSVDDINHIKCEY
jgi:predicted Zn-dependent protease